MKFLSSWVVDLILALSLSVTNRADLRIPHQEWMCACLQTWCNILIWLNLVHYITVNLTWSSCNRQLVRLFLHLKRGYNSVTYSRWCLEYYQTFQSNTITQLSTVASDSLIASDWSRRTGRSVTLLRWRWVDFFAWQIKTCLTFRMTLVALYKIKLFATSLQITKKEGR